MRLYAIKFPRTSEMLSVCKVQVHENLKQLYLIQLKLWVGYKFIPIFFFYVCFLCFAGVTYQYNTYHHPSDQYSRVEYVENYDGECSLAAASLCNVTPSRQ